MTRRRALLWSCVSGLLYGQSGEWRLRFVRVNDNVEVREGGPRGPLLARCNKGGCPDRPLHDAPSISLYARATSASGYGDCWIDVYHGNTLVSRWQFKGEQLRRFQK